MSAYRQHTHLICTLLVAFIGGTALLVGVTAGPVRAVSQSAVAQPQAPRTALSARQERPSAPLIQSPSHPDQDRWYTATTVQFRWAVPRHGGPVTGYAYAVDRSTGVLDGPRRTIWHVTTARQGTATRLGDGLWYLHVRARGAGGVWGIVASYAVHIDHAPPRVAHTVFSTFGFNPQFDRMSVRLTFSGSGTLHASVWSAKATQHLRAFAPQWVTASQPITLTWDGRDTAGSMARSGEYGFVLVLTDHVGQHLTTEYWGLDVNYRRILISLSQQRLWTYDGSTQLLTTLVTTGNSAMPTPGGIFHVWGRFHPYTFISPWPKNSIDYYPPSKASYALYFHEGGYFIHDAPWRYAFGPGTNSGVGIPGQNYTGTHGCVNVPSSVMPALFAWATTGTVVQIVN